ncbi:MAG TPA: hypothetical protein VNU66_04600 [Mycobacteriales bacterium]|nr:hypothetical protein [Mycobacteriales bacterium]
MYRSSPARKYGPIALLAAAQLVVVLVAPSTARPDADASAAALTGVTAEGLPADGLTAEGLPAEGGAVVDPATGLPVEGAAVDAGTATGTDAGAGTVDGGGTAGGPAAPTAPGGAAAPTGDTSHCRDGRQFDPALDYFAPPCAPGKPGAPVGDNGGATSFGVTADTITIVNYVPDYGAEVNAILRAQGLFYGAREAAALNTVFAQFINANYQLHGRKVKIETYQGTCRTVPPDLRCLIGEMNKIVTQFKPYAVHFNTTVCSACYAELARLKVVSFGGHGFSEEFRNALKPYNYDDKMSSSRMARVFAQWWCTQMTSKGGTGRTAVYAGGQNPAQDFRGRPRELGVVSTNDPDNKRVVKEVLYPALERGCGEKVTKEYFYEQNVSTAAQQSQAGTAIMNDSTNPATSVVCFCDPVAPQFSYNAATNNNYWPEALFATNQSMDSDATGQTYQGDLACPQRQRGCAFHGALGLGDSKAEVPQDQKPGVKVFKAAGGGTLPVTPNVAELFWDSYNMLASLIQVTGPELTPARMAASAPKLGSRGGGDTGFPRRAFEDGELSWTRDVRLLGWHKDKTSVFNGQRGAYVGYGGRRFGLGDFPTAPQPPVPTVDKRGA